MNYAQQSSAPEWFKSDDSKIYHQATSGTHYQNQWYEFDNRADAVDLIYKTFDSQSFIDRFDFAQGEVYNFEELFDLLNEQFGADHDFSEVIDDADLSSLQVADLAEMINYESPF